MSHTSNLDPHIFAPVRRSHNLMIMDCDFISDVYHQVSIHTFLFALSNVELKMPYGKSQIQLNIMNIDTMKIWLISSDFLLINKKLRQMLMEIVHCRINVKFINVKRPYVSTMLFLLCSQPVAANLLAALLLLTFLSTIFQNCLERCRFRTTGRLHRLIGWYVCAS